MLQSLSPFSLHYARSHESGPSPFGSVYDNLIKELSNKYIFNEQDVQDAITAAFASPSNSYNGRVMQYTCPQQCINLAYDYYWTIYNDTHDADLAMFGSMSFESGCLNGCANGGGGNP